MPNSKPQAASKVVYKVGTVVIARASGHRGFVTAVRDSGRTLDVQCLETGMPIRNLPANLVTLA